MLKSLSLDSSLRDLDRAVAAAKYGQSTSSDTLAASERLNSNFRWLPSENGSSPYVSRPYLLKEGRLIDPMEGDEPLHPPVPNRWLIEHHLDYTDAQILERDPGHKGFTVREEFEAGTDPNDPTQFPPLCSKLSFSANDFRKKSYVLEFLGEEEDENGKKLIQIKPVTPVPNPARGNRPDTSNRSLAKGEIIPGIPFLKAIELTPKKKSINDTEYDVSELVLQNTLTGERHVLVEKNTSREYKKATIEMIDGIDLKYRLSGTDSRRVTAERGKELTLSSLDGKHSETYKIRDISKDGLVLEIDGKSFPVKSASNRQMPTSPAAEQ
jgi:hypothetical protein